MDGKSNRRGAGARSGAEARRQHPGMVQPGRREEARARREVGSGANRRPATWGMPERRSRAREVRDGRDEACGQVQPGENEERDDHEVGRTGRKGGDDAAVLVVRVGRRGAGGVGGVIVRARRMIVGARGMACRVGVEKLMRRGIGGEPSEQPDEPHRQPGDDLPEESRAAGRAGAVEA